VLGNVTQAQGTSKDTREDVGDTLGQLGQQHHDERPSLPHHRPAPIGRWCAGDRDAHRARTRRGRRAAIVVLWLIGLIHTLLVIALSLVVVNLITGRRGPHKGRASWAS
jgi:hypothetical protein